MSFPITDIGSGAAYRMALLYSKPEDNKRVDQQELAYIQVAQEEPKVP
jgi:hypothetical protein